MFDSSLRRFRPILPVICLISNVALPALAIEEVLPASDLTVCEPPKVDDGGSKEPPLLEPSIEHSVATDNVPPPENGTDSVQSKEEAVSSSNQSAGESGPIETPLLRQKLAYSVNSDEIGNLTDRILRKEMEFLRLNTNYRMIATPASKWKPWRLFAFQEASGALATAGAIHIVEARWRFWQRPALASKLYNATGPILLLTGHSVGLAGLLLEAGLDSINDWKARRKGFDAKACDRKALELKNELAQLIAERDEKVQSSSLDGVQRELLVCEGAVLKDGRDCALLEFSKLRVREGKLRAARHAGNVMGFVNWTTGGYIGALLGVLANMNRKPKLVGTAGVGFVISGAAIVASPWVTKLASNIAGKRVGKNEKKLLGQLNAEAAKSFDANRQQFTDRLSALPDRAQSTAKLIAHNEFFQLQNEALDRQAELSANEAKKAARDWRERVIASGVIGGVKLNWGTQLANAGYSWSSARNLPVPTVRTRVGGVTFRVPVGRTPLTEGQIFTRRVGIAGITYIPGTASIMLDGLQNRIRGEIASDHLKKSGKAPGQILKHRMATLDKMESLLSK